MGNDSTPNHHLIFTYGTLKRGLPNHTLIQTLIPSNDAVFLGQRTTLHSLPLIIGPFGIPYLINLPGSGQRVRGELYSVSDHGLKKLDVLEGVEVGHYERLPIEIDGGDGRVEAYFAHRGYARDMWERRERVGIAEYTEVEAEMYIRREVRPKDMDFLDAIRRFIG